jgi:acetyl-CoA acyltransferase
MKQAVVVDAVRTPMGRSKGGMFRNVRAETLSAEVMNALLKRNPELDPREIEDIVWGCVQQTLEQAFNVARFAQLLTPIPKEVSAQTVNRLCGSSMTALHGAVASIMAGYGDVFLVGGVEHMGHVPMMHGIDFNPASSKRNAKTAGHINATAEYLTRRHGIGRQSRTSSRCARTCAHTRRRHPAPSGPRSSPSRVTTRRGRCAASTRTRSSAPTRPSRRCRP